MSRNIILSPQEAHLLYRYVKDATPKNLSTYSSEELKALIRLHEKLKWETNDDHQEVSSRG